MEEINLKGKNICKINGRLVTVNDLKIFMSKIIDIHGQHENQNLMNVIHHIKYLDDFIGNEIQIIKNKYKESFFNYNNLKAELKYNYSNEKEKQREIDLLKYQLNEIDDANLKIGEEEKLDIQRKNKGKFKLC